jgi:hypothetical protein
VALAPLLGGRSTSATIDRMNSKAGAEKNASASDYPRAKRN